MLVCLGVFIFLAILPTEPVVVATGRILFVDITPYTPPFSPRSGFVPGEIIFQLHPTKCKELIISFKKQPARFDYLEKKIVGVAFRDDLKWTNHVDTINSN